jgi:uncharacterized protein (TIGR00661 family)
MKYNVQMNIIYAVCSWGLGHATRSLPVIRKLLHENNTITIISNGRSLTLLRQELGEQANYVDIPDYPMLLSENARQFMAKSLVYWPVFIQRLEHGLRSLTRLLESVKCDLILSDGRYDMYNRKIPSFFISHQMRIMNPLRIHMFETGSEIFNQFFFKRFTAAIIPDFKEDSLSGDLSHNLRRINEQKLHYVGVLSDFKKQKKKQDIDVFISISGPEPQRSMLEQHIMEQVETLQGTIVITLGKSEVMHDYAKKHITIFSFLSKEKREDLLNRSKVIVSRSGYSTIMDLAVLGKKGLIIPTPGQIEQEYLAQYHMQKGTFFSVEQQNLDLLQNLKGVSQTTGITRSCSVEKSVEAIMNVISRVR